MTHSARLIAAILVLGLLLTACTPAPAASPTAAPKPAEPAKTEAKPAAQPTAAAKPAEAAKPAASPAAAPAEAKPAAKPAGPQKPLSLSTLRVAFTTAREVTTVPDFLAFEWLEKSHGQKIVAITPSQTAAHFALVADAFAEAMMWGHREAQKKDVVAAAAKQLEGLMTPDDIARTWEVYRQINVWDPNESRFNATAGNYTADVLAKSEAIEKYLPFEQWATTKYVDGARTRLGEYKP